MAVSMPFWLAGFWRPKGMKAEKFLPLLDLETEIVPAALQNEAGIIGAALAASRA